MEYFFAIGLLVIGFTILIFGGDTLVKGAVSIASRFNISPVVIGMTIIAAGTSMPEIMTSLLASIKDTHDIAVGNIVGSNLFNLLAILGLCSLVRTNVVEKKITFFEWPMLIVFTVILNLFLSGNTLTRYEGFGFLGLLVGFLLFTIYRAKTTGYQPSDDETEKPLANVYIEIAYIGMGMGALLGGAELALKGGIAIGQLFGMSERLIGLTIISVGTGLPELATSAVASLKGRDDLAVSNVIGSNIINTLGIPGVAASISAIHVSQRMVSNDIYWLLGATAFTLPLVVMFRWRIPRFLGLVFIGIYISFLFNAQK